MEIWLFGSDKVIGDLTTDQSRLIKEFELNWSSHGVPMKPVVEFEESRFLKISSGNHEEIASGCSKDALTKFVKELGECLEVNFFDNAKIYFTDMSGDIQMGSLPDVKDAVQNSQVRSVYNLTVRTAQDFESSWKLPVERSWLTSVPNLF